jgi:riboflavin synthase alpha subunit
MPCNTMLESQVRYTFSLKKIITTLVYKSCPIMAGHALTWHVISPHVMFCHDMPCNTVLESQLRYTFSLKKIIKTLVYKSCPTMEGHALTWHVMGRHVNFCHEMPCNTVLESRVRYTFALKKISETLVYKSCPTMEGHALIGHVMSRHVMFCHDMPCNTMFEAQLRYTFSLKKIIKTLVYKSCPTMEGHALTWHVMGRHVMFCHDMPCNTVFESRCGTIFP